VRASLLRTLLGNKARVRLALVVMVTGLWSRALRMGNVRVRRKPDRRGLFLPAGRAQALRPHDHLFASLLVIDLLVVAISSASRK